MHCALKTSLAAIFWATKFVRFLYPSVSEQSLVKINIIIVLLCEDIHGLVFIMLFSPELAVVF